ncbi:MAG TPA: sigma-70 family RNA polymerase sigma factor [Methylomirabilota bacterium]|jgi:RNA polymerase sigma-70 factor (ECF subfamily)|nr:sigma-70 family RNA polymerase sigma factor [Methylomirabilota bacterium]
MVNAERVPDEQGADPDERALIETAQRDPRRFAELYAMYFDRVYAFIARRVPARSDAQDLTAEVFQQALANLGRFEWRGVPLAAWLYRIAGSAVADHYHRIARERRVPPDPDPPAAEARDVTRRASVYQAVRALPDDQGRVIRMRFAEEKSIREIAQALGRTEGAIKQLQFRALQNLRARLDQDNA